VHNTLFQRRRAERFAQLLEEAGRRRHSRSPMDDELAQYVELGQRMRTARHPAGATPAGDFRTSLRAMLVATAQREGIGRAVNGATAPGRAAVGGTQSSRDEQGDVRPVRVGLRSRRTRGAIIVGLAAGTLALSGMSAASGDAMPGDALYGVKRSTESARLALTTTDMMRGQLYLDFAGTRANEVRARRGDRAGVTNLLGDMDNQTAQGIRLLTTWAAERHDTGALDFVDAWLTTQRARLADMATTAAPRVGQSLALLSDIQHRSTKLRAALACGVAIGGADRLGPVPGDCAATGVSGGTRGGGSGSGSVGGSSGGAGNSGGGTSPVVPAPAGTDPTAVPSPAVNPQSSPTQATNPQEPKSAKPSPDHKAGAASVTSLLGGLL
jgi:uncharacterized membrane protein YgcG